MNSTWVIKNSPFEMLDIAFKRLFPDVKYTAYFQPDINDDEQGEKAFGFTDFSEDGEITIFIDSDLSINNAVEIFAHELAHAGVGVEQEHNEVWEKAFDSLFNEYNKIIGLLIHILIIAGLYAISWALCVGIMYLICLCLPLDFDLLIATGIWLIICFIRLLLPSKKGGAVLKPYCGWCGAMMKHT